MSAKTRIDGVVVVGGGYAGVHAAQAASKHGVPVTVVDPVGTYDFLPRLAAVAGGTAPCSDASAPLADLVDNIVVATAVGFGDGKVELDDGRMLVADAVVVTAGATPVWPDLPGIELAHPLRTSADAVALRQLIVDAEALVVVGGGATGVQLAGAALVAHPGLAVTVVDRDSHLLGSLDHQLGDHAAKVLRDRGACVLLDTDVDEIDSAGVVLADGERVDGLVAWAAGFEGRADDLGIEAVQDGRILVDEHLIVLGTDRTLAAGDVAYHLDGDGQPLPMSAQIAVQAGRTAGRNAARLVSGDRLDRARLRQRGWVLDIGGRRGVAALGPIPVALPLVDRVAPLLHSLVDLKHLSEIGGLDAIHRYRQGAA